MLHDLAFSILMIFAAVCAAGWIALLLLGAGALFHAWGDTVDWVANKVAPRASQDRVNAIAECITLAPVMLLAGAFAYGLVAALHTLL